LLALAGSRWSVDGDDRKFDYHDSNEYKAARSSQRPFSSEMLRDAGSAGLLKLRNFPWRQSD
jgi:hypothetical protein